jgi:hypothetical protein
MKKLFVWVAIIGVGAWAYNNYMKNEQSKPKLK